MKTRKQRLRNAFNYLMGLVVIAAILALVYQDFSWAQVFKQYKNLSLSWVGFIVFITLLCHWVRALRWQQLIKASEHKAKLMDVAEAMMLGYFVNMVFPRAGEVTRCITLNNTQRVPVSSGLGTVVAERASDLAFLFLFTLVAFVLNTDMAQTFLNENFFVPLNDLLSQLPLTKLMVIASVGIAALVIGILSFRRWYKNKFKDRITKFVLEMWRGVTGILSLRQLPLFLGYSTVIWIFYYFMTFCWFSAYTPANGIGLIAGLAIVTVGNLARTIPLQAGGAGAYHFFMAAILVLYGLNDEEGKFLALAIHALQTSFYIFFGVVFGIRYLLLTKKRNSVTV